MVSLPSPADCPGVIGAVIGLVGVVLSVLMIVVWETVPLGWYVLVASGTLWGFSILFCMIFEWDHIPYFGS
ncbi:hypothetical protein JCM30237_25150 [Halolamina litorea]|uniref:Uncharacterized protein n=1 Tax=Halolamina litorea TaxID=1515593 RepID=A0ABD6BVH9_9EURY|nr:hypothetical protein [Halolamina litorea]